MSQWFWCGLKGSQQLGPSPLTFGVGEPSGGSELSSLSCDILYPTRLPTMVRSASGLHPRTSWSSLTLAPPTCGCLLSTARARPAVSAGWAAKGTDTFLRMLGGNPLLERMVVVYSHVTCPNHVKRLALQLGGSALLPFLLSSLYLHLCQITLPTHYSILPILVTWAMVSLFLLDNRYCFQQSVPPSIHPTRPHHSPCV